MSHAISSSAAESAAKSSRLRIPFEHERRAFVAASRDDLEPELLGDERHQRMQQLQHAAENVDERVLGAAPQRRVGVRVRQYGFRQLEVPIAELVPREVVERLCDEIEAVGREVVVDRSDRRAAAASGSNDPLCRAHAARRRCRRAG